LYGIGIFAVSNKFYYKPTFPLDVINTAIPYGTNIYEPWITTSEYITMSF